MDIQLYSTYNAGRNVTLMVLKINKQTSPTHLLQLLHCKILLLDSLSLHLVTSPEKPALRKPKSKKKSKKKRLRLIWAREVIV